MLKIRMQRTGRKHQPTYRLVLTDSKSSAKSGKYLELLGNYDSRQGEKSDFKTDRISHWISVGAQVSPTVHNMLVDKKIISAKKINKLPLKKAIKKEKVDEVASGSSQSEGNVGTGTPSAEVAEPLRESVVEVATGPAA
jgi:small subunit ribosomal protein S16